MTIRSFSERTPKPFRIERKTMRGTFGFAQPPEFARVVGASCLRNGARRR
jgi:hypothetical protein